MNFHPLLPWIGSGTLFALAFTSSWSGLLIIPAFLLLFHAFKQDAKLHTIFLRSWVLGTLKGSGAISWFWYTYPITWALEGPAAVQLLIIGTYWLTTAIVIGLGIACICTILYRLTKISPTFIYATPLFWIIGEVLGSVFFSILSLGPGSTINANFSYGYTGYVISGIPVINTVAIIGGVYTLTFFVTTILVLLYQSFIQKQTKNYYNLSLATILAILIICSHIYHNPYQPHDLHVVAIATEFEKGYIHKLGAIAARDAHLKKAIITARDTDADVIILPEDSRFSNSFESADEIFDFLTGSSTKQTILIDSARARIDTESVVLRALMFDTHMKAFYATEKEYLVPQGEYVPYLHGAILKRFTDPAAYRKILSNFSYRPGSLTKNPPPSDVPQILFCFESATPSVTWSKNRSGQAPFFAHVISHSWFNEPKILWHQQDMMLRTQSIWSQTPIVTATNQAIPATYWPDGTITRPEASHTTERWSLHHTKL